jgi:hypothetical protein
MTAVADSPTPMGHSGELRSPGTLEQKHAVWLAARLEGPSAIVSVVHAEADVTGDDGP